MFIFTIKMAPKSVFLPGVVVAMNRTGRPLARVAAGVVDPSGVEPAASLPHSAPLLVAVLPPKSLLDRQRRIIQLDTRAVAMSCAGMLRAVPHRVHLQNTHLFFLNSFVMSAPTLS